MGTFAPGGSPGGGGNMARFGAAARVQAFLLESRGGVALCAGLFFLAGLWMAWNLVFLHDEGAFTFMMGQGLFDDFAPLFFLHKVKPVNVLLYAIPMQFGFRAYLVMHVVVATVAIVLACAAARRMGIGHPNMAGWVLATAGIFLVAASNGYANSDGAMFLALFLFLHASGRRLPAGMALGLLPFSRYELIVVSGLLVIWAVLRERDLRVLVGAAIPGLTLFVAGALYFGDVAWLTRTYTSTVDLPADLLQGEPSEMYALHQYPAWLAKGFLAHSPVLAAFVLFGPDRRNRTSVAFFVITLMFYGILIGLNLAQAQRFSLHVRHLTAPLPLVALVVAWALAPGGPAARAGARLVPKEVRRGGWPSLLRPGLLVAAVIVATVYLVDPGNPERQQHLGHHRTVAALKDRGLYQGQLTFTDLNPLHLDRCAGLSEARLLVNGSIRWELRRGSATAEQFERIARVLSDRGHEMDPSRLPIRKDALYLVTNRSRSADWRERLEDAGAVLTPLGDASAYAFPQGIDRSMDGGRPGRP